MKPIVLHEYTKSNFDNFTSDFLNQVTGDFTNGIVELYMGYKALVKQKQEFVEVTNKAIEWLTNQYITLSGYSNYTVTGFTQPYEPPVGVTVYNEYGEVCLRPVTIDKIGRYQDSDGNMVAYNSDVVQYATADVSTPFSSLTWAIDDTMRPVINGDSASIWSATYSHQYLYVKIQTNPSINKTANIINVYPLAGTELVSLSLSLLNGTYNTFTPNTKFPYQIIGNYEYNDALILELQGVLQPDGKYYFSLRNIEVHDATYDMNGSIKYTLPAYTSISSLTFNSDYIDQNLQSEATVQFIITQASNTSNIIYDSMTSSYGFPINKTIYVSQPATGALQLQIVLNQVSDTTPVIKWVNIEGETT